MGPSHTFASSRAFPQHSLLSASRPVEWTHCTCLVCNPFSPHSAEQAPQSDISQAGQSDLSHSLVAFGLGCGAQNSSGNVIGWFSETALHVTALYCSCWSQQLPVHCGGGRRGKEEGEGGREGGRDGGGREGGRRGREEGGREEGELKHSQSHPIYNGFHIHYNMIGRFMLC